jgi:hypothetical protein
VIGKLTGNLTDDGFKIEGLSAFLLFALIVTKAALPPKADLGTFRVLEAPANAGSCIDKLFDLFLSVSRLTPFCMKPYWSQTDSILRPNLSVSGPTPFV